MREVAVSTDDGSGMPTALAEQFGLAYAPTYSVVFTFVIMVLALAFRPRGIMGRPA